MIAVVGLAVRTERRNQRSGRMLEAVPGGFPSGLDRNRVNRKEQAAAIGAGTPTGSERRAMCSGHRNEREGCQHAEYIVEQMHYGGFGYRDMCANTSPARESSLHPSETTIRTSKIGRPMTVADKEKDRCANTGLLRKVSLVVTFGTRSDRRQTA